MSGSQPAELSDLDAFCFELTNNNVPRTLIGAYKPGWLRKLFFNLAPLLRSLFPPSARHADWQCWYCWLCCSTMIDVTAALLTLAVREPAAALVGVPLVPLMAAFCSSRHWPHKVYVVALPSDLGSDAYGYMASVRPIAVVNITGSETRSAQ